MIFVITPFGIFLSTPSARRATDEDVHSQLKLCISIHALREEGDLQQGGPRTCSPSISIHALREEGDRDVLGCHGDDIVISIHALREEGDLGASSTTSAGGRISIHALREEGDYQGRMDPEGHW